METRKGAPLIESSQRPAASAARRPADPLLAGALGRRPAQALKEKGQGCVRPSPPDIFTSPIRQTSSPPPPARHLHLPHRSGRWALSWVLRSAEYEEARSCSQPPSTPFITPRKVPFQVCQETLSAHAVTAECRCWTLSLQDLPAATYMSEPRRSPAAPCSLHRPQGGPGMGPLVHGHTASCSFTSQMSVR